MGSPKLPGRSWRFQAWGVKGADRDPLIRLSSDEIEGASEFDELVVGNWLHVEQMDHRFWWIRVGPMEINIRINTDGTYDTLVADITGERHDELLRWKDSKLVDE